MLQSVLQNTLTYYPVKLLNLKYTIPRITSHIHTNIAIYDTNNHDLTGVSLVDGNQLSVPRVTQEEGAFIETLR